MLRLIYYQFQYSKKQWLGTVPVLFVASLVAGIAVNGIISISKDPSLANSDNGPSVVFNGLIVFGGLTLFLLVSGLIQFLISLFKKDYELWTILGANRSQLSFLISGQLFIIAFITSLFGSFLSIFATQKFYNYLQLKVGKELMPPLSISFDMLGCLLTVLIVSGIAAISGYHYSWKNLKKVSGQQKRNLSLSMGKAVMVLLLLSSWIACIVAVFLPLNLVERDVVAIKMSLVTTLLLVNLMIIQLISPYIQIFVIEGLSYLFSFLDYHFTISKWLVVYDRSYLKLLQSSVTMAVTLISGFQIFLASTGEVNTLLSFLMYLLAPLLLILANIISITVLASDRAREDANQFDLLGLTRRDIGLVRFCEGLIHALTTFIVALLFNFLVFMVADYVSKEFHSLPVKTTGLYSSGIIISLILLILIFITKMTVALPNSSSRKQ
ncbi:FtsX-like permease family protein [Streptococcus orisasini]|uniref:FtsX-like permease family protein n=1 Tax=Streptococcus orisasini TaxID=1080071 RepID=UPI00070F9F9E|nr:FtsX-like permease family protein [Streptococcus orisasini]